MKAKPSRLLPFILSATVFLYAQQVQPLVLHEGAPVRMKINRTISSANAAVGEHVDFETLDDVKIGDTIVIPKGSTAIGTVTNAQPKGHLGRGGKLDMNIDYVRMPNGEKLPLRGVQNANGGGHTAAMTGAIVATSIIFFPAAPLFLFMKGKDITIPQGHEITVYTNTEYSAHAANLVGQSNSASPAFQPAGPVLTNMDILALRAAGLGDDVIIQKIKSSPGRYALGVDDLTALKKAGLPDAIISAMLGAHSTS